MFADRFRAVAHGREHAVFAAEIRQVFVVDVVGDVAERIAEQGGPVRGDPGVDVVAGRSDLGPGPGWVVDAEERTARHAIDAGGRNRGVIVVPTVVFDGDQARGLGTGPPGVVHPAAPDQADPIDVRARLRRSDHERGQVQVRLRLRAALVDEVAQAVVEAALRAMGRMLEVVEIEARAIVAGQGDAAIEVAIGATEELIDDPVQRHDAQAEVVDQAQVGGERPRVVAGVVVAGDIDGMVGEDGNAHGQVADSGRQHRVRARIRQA